MRKASKNIFVCQACGATSSRWSGKCGTCEEWNSLVEDANQNLEVFLLKKNTVSHTPLLIESVSGQFEKQERIETHIQELNRVTGGGLVPSSAILISGEPGIGKSTLLLQLAADLSQSKRNVLYFSGEEATSQVRLRAERLGLLSSTMGLVAETHVGKILSTLSHIQKNDVVIIDSIQTLWSDQIDAAPGSVSQVRYSTQALIRYAKNCGTALILVGHVTKEGQIAGPKIVEHMVDTVLYFEGDTGHPYRVLRATKNRFGATDEIAVFEMQQEGLKEILNPSELFLGERDQSIPGNAVFPGIEGTRPILVEFQALVLPSSLATPRRAVVGWDPNRLSMILAVLQARCGLSLANHEIFLNVAGGLKIYEPAADLAVVAALLSASSGVPFSRGSVCFGEVSLSGSVRPTGHTNHRLKEANKLGFQEAIISKNAELGCDNYHMTIKKISHVKEIADQIFGKKTAVV
ncbi:MAG: DNA repair protein RadA [Hyphomicrobium sp.]